MTQAALIGIERPGAERSEAERLAAQWPNLPRNLFGEGEDCYGDPDRAAYVEASYAALRDKVSQAESGDLMLLIGRRHDRLTRNGFERIIALGEMAGGGADVMLDFREGKILFPTTRYALLVRHSLTALTGYSGPEVYEGRLESDSIISWGGMLPPKEDLMDSALHTRLDGNGRRPIILSSVDEEEIWNRNAEIAIGGAEVADLMGSTLATNGSQTRGLYAHDFTALEEVLGA